MTALQCVILIVGSLLLIAMTIVVMARINEGERRYMQRRRAEWIAGGRIPEDEPKFFSGNGSSV
jgi:hypothetical protein